MKKKFGWIAGLLLFAATFMTSCGPNDTKIQAAVESAIKSNPDMAGLNATVKDGVATITGECKDEASKSAVESTVAQVKGVKQVVNNCTVAPPPPPPAPVIVSADETLTRNVSDALKDYPGVTASVKDGVITLTGDIKRANLQKLMQTLNSLKPKKIENKLTIK